MIQQDLRMRRRSDECGFTLTQLLVGVSILGILTAVVVFAVRGTGDLTDTQQPGSGPATQVDVVKLGSFNSPTPGGFPSPFAFGQGPGFNNMHYLFDSLTWKDASGAYIPWLATSLGTVSPDGLTVTYTLRDGVQFSNGDPLTAEDVAFTFDYIRPGGMFSAGANLPGSFYYSLNYIADVVAGGASPATGIGGTVTFTMTAPFVPFEAMIGSRIPILPKNIWSTVSNPATYGSPTDPDRTTVENGQTRAQNAVTGSGPYKLDSPETFVSSGPPPAAPPSYSFTAKTGSTPATKFFLGTPVVRRLEYVPAGSNQLTTLQAGTIDGASAADGVAPPAALDGFGRIEGAGENVRAIHFNLRTGGARTGANVSGSSFPYDEPAFRQAVAYALDRKQLVSNVLAGRGEVGSMGALAPSNFFANPNLPTYERDLVKAGQLLDSLDIRDTNGDGMRELPCTMPCARANFTPTVRSQAAPTDTTNPLVKTYLENIGIGAVIEAAVAVPQFTSGNYDIGMLSYGAMGAEPDQLRNRLSFSDPNPQFTDVYGWNNTEFESLAYEQVSERDPAVRRQKLFRMQELVAQDVPLISLYVPTRTWVYSAKPVPWYFTPGGLWAGWPGAPSKQLFVVGKKTGLP